MDAAIDRAEKLVSSVSVGEVNFKLVLATTRLTDSVATLEKTVTALTATVASLTDDINGGKGVRVEMHDIRRDISDTDRKIADVSGKLDASMQNVTDKMHAAMTVFWRVAWFLCIVGIITVITEIRAFAPMILGGGK